MKKRKHMLKRKEADELSTKDKQVGTWVFLILRQILIHICMISCIVVAVVSILDWYNPYMDFAGHIAFAQPCLIISALLVSIQAFIK
ncbi:hypothetical protein BN3660_03005 [Eubacteriaceae bacterium CHKCI004]|nr:hypothetical protein BN3660_03005 [Eubacteriaceae bacterium CHKCI004]